MLFCIKQSLKLSNIKGDSRFTTTCQLVKLIGSHTISRVTLRIADLKRQKMVGYRQMQMYGTFRVWGRNVFPSLISFLYPNFPSLNPKAWQIFAPDLKLLIPIPRRVIPVSGILIPDPTLLITDATTLIPDPTYLVATLILWMRCNTDELVTFHNKHLLRSVHKWLCLWNALL